MNLRLLNVLTEFACVQAVVQLGLALSGILIVRTLSKADYALFAATNSMQTICTALADTGLSIGLMSLGGRVWQDRERFRQLLSAALGLRRRFSLAALAVCVPIAAWFLTRNGASPGKTLALCALLVAGILPLVELRLWVITSQLFSEYRKLQKTDLTQAWLRLGLLAGLSFAWLNALGAVAAGVLSNWLQWLLMRRGQLVSVSSSASEPDDHRPSSSGKRDDRQELLRLSRQCLPNTLFFCVQGQLTTLILMLARNPVGVADFTALGRITAIFTVVTLTFANVLAPRFARCQQPARLPGLYARLSGGVLMLLLPLAGLAWLVPGIFLWILGDKYTGLGGECGWLVTAGCVAHLGGVMWSLNSSKGWIRLQSRAFIPLVLATQLAGAAILNLRELHGALIFNLINALTPLPLYVADAVLGLRAAASVSINSATVAPVAPDPKSASPPGRVAQMNAQP